MLPAVCLIYCVSLKLLLGRPLKYALCASTLSKATVWLYAGSKGTLENKSTAPEGGIDMVVGVTFGKDIVVPLSYFE